MAFEGRFDLSPDGRTVATTRPDGSIELWDVISGKSRIRLDGHEGHVNALAFSPDSKILASGGADPQGRFAAGTEQKQDKTIKLWDVATGRNLATLVGHRKGTNHLVFAPDGKTLVATDFSGSMKLWDLKTSRVLATLKRVKIGDRVQGTPIGWWAVALI